MNLDKKAVPTEKESYFAFREIKLSTEYFPPPEIKMKTNIKRYISASSFRPNGSLTCEIKAATDMVTINGIVDNRV